MHNDDYQDGYETGCKDTEKHMVSEEMVHKIEDGHYKQMENTEAQLSAALRVLIVAKGFNHNDDNCSICIELKAYESQYGELK